MAKNLGRYYIYCQTLNMFVTMTRKGKTTPLCFIDKNKAESERAWWERNFRTEKYSVVFLSNYR